MSDSVPSAQSRRTSLRDTAINAANEGGAWILRRLESWVIQHSQIETTPFLSPESFPWVKLLEDNFDEIRTELDEVLR